MPRSLIFILACLVLPLVAGESLAPGKHSKLDCAGDPEQTWDAYVPKAYATDEKTRFPVLFISGPGGNPGFMGVDSWAEREGVLLVTVNRSRNGPSEPILAAQKAVIAAAESRLRLHPCLRFAMGMSGAGQASWLLVGNRPQQSAGVLLMGQGGFDSPWPAKHVAVGYIIGEKDDNRSYVDGMFKRLQSDGHQVRRTVVPGGHVSGSAQDRVRLLDWMLNLARFGHPGLTADDRKKALAVIETRITALATLATAEEREKEAAALLELPPVLSNPGVLAKTATIWRAAALERIAAISEPRAQVAAILPLTGDARMRSSPEAAQLMKLLTGHRKDATCKDEFDAWTAWQNQSALIPDARNDTAKKRLGETLRELAKRWPGTAGAKAAEAAQREFPK